ncbi:ABC transporter ATP-binding protein [Blastococcus sp. SYSU DS0616]
MTRTQMAVQPNSAPATERIGVYDMSDQVVFRDIHKSFGGVPAVVDMNLSVKRGEFFTLLGPSGSGKTTTLRMLAGLEGLTSGEILIDGRDVSREVAEKRNIGLVFQNYALFPHMTVADNVAFPLKMRRFKKPAIAEKVARVLAMTQLEEYSGRYPRQLSGGQQQRVALARAFVFDPSILLMDEPLGALDRNLRDHMRLELKALQQRIGATVLYVTHDQDEALAMSDRIGVMHRGLLQQVASPEEMYERPRNSFVANFLGNSVCLPAKRRERGSQTVVDVEGLSDRVLVHAGGDVCDEDSGIFMVRPEKLRIGPDEPSSPALNRFQGTVEATVYLGSDVQVYVRHDAGAQIEAMLPASVGAPPAGARQWVSWDPSDTRFLPVVE